MRANTATIVLLQLFSATALGGTGTGAGTLHSEDSLTCQDSEEIISLSVWLDAHPEETGWTLECHDTSTVAGVSISFPWYIVPGAFDDVSLAHTWVEDAACIPTSAMCNFTMIDETGNGMGYHPNTRTTGTDNNNNNSKSGVFALNYAGQNVVYYDNHEPFFERTYCVGMGCNKEMDNDEEQCRHISLDIMLDEQPHETSFQLTCDDQLLWDYPTAHATPRGANGNLVLNTCVSQDACCTFTINDSGNDGLSAGDFGYFILEVDSTKTLYYNGMDKTPFERLSKSFGGPSCSIGASVSAEPLSSNAPKEGPTGLMTCPQEDDQVFNLNLHLDSHPEQNSWFLVCDNGTPNGFENVWNVPRASLDTANAHVERNICISPQYTCVFTMVDQGKDGLLEGGYTLSYGDEIVGTYSQDSQGGFEVNSYCFGPDCNFDAITSRTDNDEEDLVVGFGGNEKQSQDSSNSQDSSSDSEDQKNQQVPCDTKSSQSHSPSDSNEPLPENSDNMFGSQSFRDSNTAAGDNDGNRVYIGVIIACLVLVGLLIAVLHVDKQSRHQHRGAFPSALPGLQHQKPTVSALIDEEEASATDIDEESDDGILVVEDEHGPDGIPEGNPQPDLEQPLAINSMISVDPCAFHCTV